METQAAILVEQGKPLVVDKTETCLIFPKALKKVLK